jgi:peptidoglycan-associated lipoprotein
MKKIMMMVLAAGLIMVMAGCAKKQLLKPATGPTITKLDRAKISLPKENNTERELGLKGQQFFHNVYFDFDSYALKSEFRTSLTETARFLRQTSDVKLKLDGHCDERGTIEYNLALGDKRANAVKRYLVDQGAKKENISTFSYGKERPVVPGHGEEAWAQNRRTEGNFIQP